MSARSFVKSIRSVLSGSSILRTEHDSAMASLDFPSGDLHVLEIGAKPGSTSHLKYMPSAPKSHTTLGLDEKCDLVLDLEKELAHSIALPRPVNVVIATNVFEHIFDVPKALDNLNQILTSNPKPGDLVHLMASTPFVHKYHPDPQDFGRPTIETLNRWFAGSPFDLDSVIYFGVGPFTSASHVIGTVLPLRSVRVFLYAVAKLLDMIFSRLSKEPDAWHLGLAWRATLRIRG